MESNYDNLFILINITLLMINFVMLFISARQYQYERYKVDDNELDDETRMDETSYQPIKEGSKRADLLISKVTEDRLLHEFEKAQTTLFFLKRNVSINDVADLLGTNQRYASYIINKYVGLDFNSYVQQERIKYLIESVEHDPNLLKEKFSVLADKAGFSSVSKFSSVFKSVKGTCPSKYFQGQRIGL